MEFDRIEQLLEKYFEATTTVGEEKELKTYFEGSKIAPQLEQYAPMFTHFKSAKNEKYTKALSIKAKKPKAFWYSIAAASIVLLCGLYFMQPQKSGIESEYTAEEIAAAQEALQLLAFNFNKGSQQMSYIGEFEKNTNKFLK